MLLAVGETCLHEQILAGFNASPLSWRGGGGGLSCFAIAVTPAAKAPYVGLTIAQGKMLSRSAVGSPGLPYSQRI